MLTAALCSERRPKSLEQQHPQVHTPLCHSDIICRAANRCRHRLCDARVVRALHTFFDAVITQLVSRVFFLFIFFRSSSPSFFLFWRCWFCPMRQAASSEQLGVPQGSVLGPLSQVKWEPETPASADDCVTSAAVAGWELRRFSSHRQSSQQNAL